jgi:hypothetical protein
MDIFPFQLLYPTHVSPTLTWSPSINPSKRRSLGHYVPAIIHQMADLKTAYGYAIGEPGEEYVLEFEAITEAERVSLQTFLDAVLMAPFEFRDHISGSYLSAIFHPEMNLRFTAQRYAADLWTIPLRLLTQ